MTYPDPPKREIKDLKRFNKFLEKVQKSLVIIYFTKDSNYVFSNYSLSDLKLYMVKQT